jgi:hypothetical protein
MRYIFMLIIVMLLLGCNNSKVNMPNDNLEDGLEEDFDDNLNPSTDSDSLCIDRCGDGVCDEIVCQGSECPCPETEESCPSDCKIEIPEIIEPESENDPVVDELIEKTNKIKKTSLGGLKYTYSTSDTSLKYQVSDEIIYKELGDIIVLDYGVVVIDDEGYRYNFLYVDKSKDKAYAVCSGTKVDCRDGLVGKEIELKKEMLPVDPIEELKSLRNAKMVMKYTYDRKPSIVLEEERTDHIIKVYAWEFGGVPLFIEKKYGSRIVEYRYNDMSFNTLKDEDVSFPEGLVI